MLSEDHANICSVDELYVAIGQLDVYKTGGDNRV